MEGNRAHEECINCLEQDIIKILQRVPTIVAARPVLPHRTTSLPLIVVTSCPLPGWSRCHECEIHPK
ncbi:hypothetical protein ACLOJK_015057, partial [Asimina triloba]